MWTRHRLHGPRHDERIARLRREIEKLARQVAKTEHKSPDAAYAARTCEEAERSRKASAAYYAGIGCPVAAAR